jgi:tetratricopeptide (TPR) repeat protein
MKTLYDFLGALPDDDAESLRAAFRRAAKGAHPDLHPGDPDAALRFRQLVRANDILSDEAQRTAYDRLLALARLEQEAAPKRAAAAVIYRVANGAAYSVIFLASVLVVSVAGYVLFGLANATVRVPAQMTEVSGHELLQATAVTTGLAHTNDRTDGPDKVEAVGAPEKRDEDLEDSKRTTSAAAPSQGTASATASANVPLVRDYATNDAKHYRERGISAYRTGDLHLALVDFDLAIQFDPASPDAYIDRAIVFYRLGHRERAFADIAQARRIHQESNRDKALPVASEP